jgi:hypothetical protein
MGQEAEGAPAVQNPSTTAEAMLPVPMNPSRTVPSCAAMPAPSMVGKA